MIPPHADDRCPRCYRGGMLRDDGTVEPHRRLSSDGRPTSVMVWCVPVARSSRRRNGNTCEPRGAA